MDATYFMGIDTGTQGVRVAVSNKEGVLLFEEEKKWETLFPKKGWAPACSLSILVHRA